MSTRRVLIVSVMVTLLVGVTGWAQRGRGPGSFRGGRPGVEIRVESHGAPHPPMGARHIIVGGRPYWVYGGAYYVLGDDGSYVVVGAPVVRVLPPYYRVVVIGGVAYYVVDDVYYRPGPGGYVVVERPPEPAKVVAPAPEPPGNTRTLYVPKKDSDGFVPVTLKKIDGGYLGPQGEFYPTMPPVALLTEMYGIPEMLRDGPSDRSYFIHVPNKDGQTYTRVELIRRDNGFVGPQGEFYPIMPSVAHLAQMYGTGNEAAKAADIAPPVPAAEAAPPVPAAEAPKTDEIHVQVHKKSGPGTVDIVLKKRDNGYLGPQGEFYPEMPSPSQLTEVYGGE
jgi:hypothetical protein